jgi:hypothetical protein
MNYILQCAVLKVATSQEPAEYRIPQLTTSRNSILPTIWVSLEGDYSLVKDQMNQQPWPIPWLQPCQTLHRPQLHWLLTHGCCEIICIVYGTIIVQQQIIQMKYMIIVMSSNYRISKCPNLFLPQILEENIKRVTAGSQQRLAQYLSELRSEKNQWLRGSWKLWQHIAHIRINV